MFAFGRVCLVRRGSSLGFLFVDWVGFYFRDLFDCRRTVGLVFVMRFLYLCLYLRQPRGRSGSNG